MYQIKSYSYKKAKELGVEIKSSTVKNKKIDVFKDGKKIASIGDINYSDYPTYLEKEGKSVADERRRLYHMRHQKDKNKVGSPGYYASRILW